MSNFGDLVNIEDFGDKREDFNPERGEVTFYCKDCQKIVKVEKPDPKGFKCICTICDGKNIAIGTEAGIQSKFKIK